MHHTDVGGGGGGGGVAEDGGGEDKGLPPPQEGADKEAPFTRGKVKVSIEHGAVQVTMEIPFLIKLINNKPYESGVETGIHTWRNRM